MSRAGLLAPFVPPEGAVELLNKFSASKRNEVWLLSGLPVKSLEKVAAKAPGVGIVAENGCFAKIPAQNGKGGVWISMVANLNLTWKGLCVEILNYVRVFLAIDVIFYFNVGVVHGTNAWFVRRGARGVCGVAFLDWSDG
jgi:hypothetical protein